MSEDIRWSEETALAAKHLGWRIVDTAGVSDYQGWGVHLLSRPKVAIEGGLDSLDIAAEEMVANDAELAGRTEDAASLRARIPTAWAVLAWSYGSCSGCDEYEDKISYPAEPEQCAAVFADLIDAQPDHETALAKFESSKGW